MRRLALICFIAMLTSSAVAQEEDKKVFLNGYLKEMGIIDFSPEDQTLYTNLVHNRLNFKWFSSSKWSVYVEQRTRYYAGDYVELIPNFNAQLEDTEDFFDLSWVIWSNETHVLHTMVDRAFVEYAPEGWNFRLGRQRINWGVSLAWNPNDIFNAYSYVDFDYEERPGSDAFRLQKFFGFASSLEFATNVADSLGSWVSAVKYATNKNNYDLQAIAGIAKKDLTLGGAWAGNIKGAGAARYAAAVANGVEKFAVTQFLQVFRADFVELVTQLLQVAAHAAQPLRVHVLGICQPVHDIDLAFQFL